MTYKEFLENKIDIAPLSGIEIDPSEINPVLKPHQRTSVLWALRGGRRGIFARFGLGKTAMQLEWCNQPQKHEGGQALIVMPLNVMPEFRADAVNLLGMTEPPYCRTMTEVKASDAPIILTNYERVRDGDIDPHYFTAVSLDEAATLRSFGSKTYQEFMLKFKGVRYKLTNTATPSPNRYKELIHYAGFLEVMDTGQALTRFFKRDSPDEHFVIWHDLENERKALKKAIPEMVDIYGSMELETREKRVMDFAQGRTRLFGTKKSLSGSGCNFQRFCHRAIFMGIDYEFNDFIQAVHRIYRFLQDKPVVIDILYMDTESEILLALQRKWRQYDELSRKMEEIIKEYGLGSLALESLKRTIGCERVEITGKSYTAINNDCVEEIKNWPTDSIDLYVTSIPFGNHYEYSPSYNDFGHNPDDNAFFEQMDYLTPELLRTLKPGRVAAIHVKDRVQFGNVTGMGMPTIEPFHADCISHFIKHGFAYFGMITVVTDVVRENNQTYRLGWTEQCKDGTKMGVGCPEYILLFRKLPTDHSKGYADVRVAKSKEEYTRAQWQLDAHAFWRSSGDRPFGREDLEKVPTSKLQSLYRKFSRENVYSYDEHVKLAESLDKDGRLPSTFMVVAPGSWDMTVWDDINRMKTLNTSQSQRRQQMHVCPLQIDIVERLINRYSNPGDLVADPFAGLFTVPYEAVKMGRRGKGVELNPDYFRDGVGYLEAADAQQNAPTLFDLLESMEGA